MAIRLRLREEEEVEVRYAAVLAYHSILLIILFKMHSTVRYRAVHVNHVPLYLPLLHRKKTNQSAFYFDSIQFILYHLINSTLLSFIFLLSIPILLSSFSPSLSHPTSPINFHQAQFIRKQNQMTSWTIMAT